MTPPIIRKTDWRAFPLHLAILALLVALIWLLVPGTHGATVFVVAVGLYVLAALALSYTLLGHYRRGMALLGRSQFAEAIPCLTEAYRSLTQRSWIDRYRFLTLLDASAYSYREVILCNIAFAHGQLGHAQEAVDWYKRAANEFPGSPIAEAALSFARGFEIPRRSSPNGAA
jgi:tetratricopeptide (TPR) repeat protein